MIKLHVDYTVGFFPEPAVWLWSWSILIKVLFVCASMADTGKKLHFSLSGSLIFDALLKQI